MGALAVGVGLVLLFSFTGDENDTMENQDVVADEMASEATLPSDLPANIPIYPGSELIRVQDIPSDSARNVTLTLETADSVADVNTWYRGALSQSPWAVTSDQNVSGYILLKGENDNVVVFMQAARQNDEGGAVITERIQIK